MQAPLELADSSSIRVPSMSFPEMAEADEPSARLLVSSITRRTFTRTNLRNTKACGISNIVKTSLKIHNGEYAVMIFDRL